MHPQPRVQNEKAHEHSHHGHTGFTRHSPRNGFTAYFVLSPVPRLIDTVVSGVASANLTPASGCQNDTTSPSASGRVRLARCRVHRIPPRVRDDRETPLYRDGTVRLSELICLRPKQKYFCKRGWTGHF